MKVSRIAEITPIDDMVKAIEETSAKATQVVGWYGEPDATVRGPYGRWLHVCEVPEQYKSEVGSSADDARYAAACMTYAPALANEVVRLQELVNGLLSAMNDAGLDT